jgi:hypothetical protein
MYTYIVRAILVLTSKVKTRHSVYVLREHIHEDSTFRKNSITLVPDLWLARYWYREYLKVRS